MKHLARDYALGSIIFLLLAGASGAWLYSGAQGLQRAYEVQAKHNADNYAHRAGIAVERRCVPLPAEAEYQCRREEAEAAHDGQRNEYDLQAQLVTSAWTRTMGIAAIIAMAVGILGVGLIFVTFRQTRRAADAAHDANRAWVRIEAGETGKFGISHNEMEFSTDLILTNHGSSPALDVWSDGFISFRCPSDTEVLEHVKAAKPDELHGRTVLFQNVPEGTGLYLMHRGERPNSSAVFVTIFACYRIVGDERTRYTAITYTTKPSDASTRLYAMDGDAFRLSYGYDVHQRISVTLAKGQCGLPLAT